MQFRFVESSEVYRNELVPELTQSERFITRQYLKDPEALDDIAEQRESTDD